MRYSFILLAILCTACGTALPTVKPYKLDVQQGNVVTSKMLLQLRPGMTKSQVRFIMGTPLIQDSFHDKRWDYVYQLRENGKITEQRRVILDFENELLKSVRGDVTPTSADKAKDTDLPVDTGTRVVKPSAKPEEKGVMSKLKFWEKDDAGLAKDKAAKEAEQAKEKAGSVDAAKTPVPTDNSAPADESKSMLAVPLKVLPAAEIPNPATAVEAAPVETAPAVVEPDASTPKVESVPVEAAPIQTAPVERVPPVQEPISPPAYDSPAGMQFDKNLKVMPEEAAPESKVVAPRAGNKDVPKPQDLPPESSPGFFDRMLEKIGF